MHGCIPAISVDDVNNAESANDLKNLQQALRHDDIVIRCDWFVLFRYCNLEQWLTKCIKALKTEFARLKSVLMSSYSRDPFLCTLEKSVNQTN